MTQIVAYLQKIIGWKERKGEKGLSVFFFLGHNSKISS